MCNEILKQIRKVISLYGNCVGYMLPDSVEEGEKIVNTAVDKFGRIGESRYIFGTKADSVVGRLTV